MPLGGDIVMLGGEPARPELVKSLVPRWRRATEADEARRFGAGL
jgi:hypothetical protein